MLTIRGAPFKEYKEALIESGLDHDLLTRFGLENGIVGDGKRKQDSHAEVQIGLGATCEVLNGSVNVVHGGSKKKCYFPKRQSDWPDDAMYLTAPTLLWRVSERMRYQGSREALANGGNVGNSGR